MKFFYYISFFQLVCTNLYSQFQYLPYRPYEKLQYEDFTPDWYEVNYDSNIVSDSTDGYNYFNIAYNLSDILDKNFLYSIDLKGSKCDYFEGVYLTKRDLETGELIWRVNYGMTDVDRQEVAILSYLNNDENIEIIGLLKTTTLKCMANSSIDGNFDLIFTKRIFNSKDGSLMYFNNPNFDDTSLEKCRFSYFGQSNPVYIENDGKIRRFASIYLDTISYKVGYISILLDSNNGFKVIERDTLETVFNTINAGDIHSFQLPTKISSNEFLFVEKILKQNENRIFLRYTDKNLNVKEEYISDVFGENVNYLSLRMISKDQDKLLFINVANIFSQTEKKRYDIIITNRQGKILQQIYVPSEYVNNYEIYQWNDDNSLKIFASQFKHNPYYQQLEFLNVDNNGNIEVIKEFKPRDSLRVIYTRTVRKLPNNKFLIRLRESSLYKMPPFNNIVSDYVAKATSHMLVDGSYFDISNSVEESHTSNKVELYPSLTLGSFTLNFTTSFTGKVEIYTCEGTLCKSIFLNQTYNENIECEELPKGLYLVKLTDGTKKIKRPVLKFAKI